MKETIGDKATGHMCGYDARIKVCPRRECMLGLNNTVSSEVKAPAAGRAGSSIVPLPVFAGTELSNSEKAALLAEGIEVMEEEVVEDPRDALKGTVRVGGSIRRVGMDPAKGDAGDLKIAGVVMEVRQISKAVEEERRRRADEVGGRKVRNRNTITKGLKEAGNLGLMYRGRVLSSQPSQALYGTWFFKVETIGNGGVDTGRTHNVEIGKRSECSCETFRKMLASQREPYYFCRHIYAIFYKVLKFPRDSPIPHQMALNQIELEEVFAKKEDLKGLER